MYVSTDHIKLVIQDLLQVRYRKGGLCLEKTLSLNSVRGGAGKCDQEPERCSGIRSNQLISIT